VREFGTGATEKRPIRIKQIAVRDAHTLAEAGWAEADWEEAVTGWEEAEKVVVEGKVSLHPRRGGNLHNSITEAGIVLGQMDPTRPPPRLNISQMLPTLGSR
jgi:hypothetical protein